MKTRCTVRRLKRGQALVEMVIVLPLIVMLMLGAADLGRAFYLNVEMAGASRAGMREGIKGPSSDLGNSVRNEVFDAIDNSVAVWGGTGPGAQYDGCGSSAGSCGDPTGCQPSVFIGTRVACFAVRTCTITNGACSAYGVWGSRPVEGSNQALQIRVVYKFTPVTPMISAIAGPGGVIDITSDTYGLELY
jgi:TadE-like protein